MPLVLKPSEVIKVLEKNGFMYVSQRGSHRKFKNEESGCVVIVPMHYELARGTLSSIINQSGLTLEHFTDYAS